MSAANERTKERASERGRNAVLTNRSDEFASVGVNLGPVRDRGWWLFRDNEHALVRLECMDLSELAWVVL